MSLLHDPSIKDQEMSAEAAAIAAVAAAAAIANSSSPNTIYHTPSINGRTLASCWWSVALLSWEN
jgi:hypothetical protein